MTIEDDDLLYEYGEGIERYYNKSQYWRTKSNE
jgi:hypothetical protein